MANKFWETIKNTASNIFGGKNNTSTGSSGAGTAVSAPAQPAQPVQPRQQSTITSYNSGIAGTREYARNNMQAFHQQYDLAQKAGVSENDFYSQYASGTRWLDQANKSTPAISQYNSGVRGTREYAASHMDEFNEQYKFARQAGISDDQFYQSYADGVRWRDERSNLEKAMNGGEKGPGLVDKVTSWANDSQLWNDWQDRRMERWQKKYGSGVFADDFWGQTQANYGQAFLAQELNRMYNDLADNPDDEHDRQYISQLEQMLENYQIRNEKALDDENVQAAWISKHMAGYAPQLVAEVVPAAGAAAVGLLVAGPAGAWNAYRIARTITSGINGYEVTRGASYSSLVKAGASPDVARAAATDEAVISSIIEMGDTAVDLFARIPGLGKILGRGGEQVAVKTVGGILKSYGLNVAQEGAEEFFQEILSAANQERVMAGEGDSGYGGLIKYWLRYQLQLAKGEHSDELAQAMEAAKGGAIIGAVMGGAHLVGGRIQQGVNDRQVSSILQRIEENPDGLAYAKDENLEYYLKRAQQDGATKNENAAKLIQQELDTRNKLRDSIVDQNGKPVYRYMNDNQKAELKAQLETMQRDDITSDKVDLLGLHILYDQCLACGADDRIADMLSDEYYARMHEVEQRQADAAAQGQTQEVAPEAPQNPAIEEQPAPVAEEPITSPVEEQVQPAEAVETEPENPILETTRRGNRSKYTAKQLQKMTDAQLEQELAKANQLGDQKTVAAIEKELDVREEAANVTRKDRLRAESQKAAAQTWLDSLKNGKKPQTKQAPFGNEMPRPGENAQNVLQRTMRKEQKSNRESDAQQKRRVWGDTEKDAQRQNNDYPDLPDSATINGVTGEAIPASLSANDVNGFADYYGLSDSDVVKMLTELYNDINENGYAVVFGHKATDSEIALLDAIEYDRDQSLSDGVVGPPRPAGNRLIELMAQQNEIGYKSRGEGTDIAFNVSTTDRDSKYHQKKQANPNLDSTLMGLTSQQLLQRLEKAKENGDESQQIRIRNEFRRRGEYSMAENEGNAFPTTEETNKQTKGPKRRENLDNFASSGDLITDVRDIAEEISGVVGYPIATPATDAYAEAMRENPMPNSLAEQEKLQQLRDRAERELEELKDWLLPDSDLGLDSETKLALDKDFDIIDSGNSFESNMQNASIKDVDGKKVFNIEKDGDVFEQVAVGDENANGKGKPNTYIVVGRGGHVLPSSTFGKNFQRFKDFMKKWFISDITSTDTAFKQYVFNKATGQYEKRKFLNAGLYSISSGGRFDIAVFAMKSGTFLHEDTHHLQTLAERVDSKKARRLIESIFNPANQIVDQDILGEHWEHVREQYQDAIDRRVDRIMEKYRADNPNISDVDYELYGKKVSEAATRYIVSREVLAHIAGKQGQNTEAISRAAKKLVNSAQFRQLLELAGQYVNASSEDIELHYNLFVESANADGNLGFNLQEVVDTYAQLSDFQARKDVKNGRRKTGPEESDASTNRVSGIGKSEERLERGTRAYNENSWRSVAVGSDRQNGGRYSHGDRGAVLTNPEKNARTQNAYLDSLERQTPPHTEEDYRETYGKTGFDEMEQKQPQRTKADAIPRDVTAEEREFAAQQDYEQSEQRAEDAMRGRGERMFMDYGKKDNAWRVFNAAMDITQRKFGFDTKADEDMTPDDKAKRKAMNSLREAAKAVAEGRTSGYEFAKFLQKAQKDYRLGQYLSSDTEKYLFNAVQSVVDAYEDAIETSSPAAVGRYAHETERAIKMLSKRMERWDLADRQKTTLGEEADRTVGSDKRKSRRKARFNQSGETFADSAANFLTRMQINPTNVFRGLFGGWNKYGGSLGYQISEQQDNATRVNQSIISTAQMAFLDVRKMKGFQKFAQQKDVKAVNLMGGTMNLSQQQIVGLYKTVRTLLADQRQSVNQISIQDEKGKAQTLYSLNDKGEAIPFSREDLKDMQRELWGNIDEVGKAYLDVADDILEDLGRRNADVEETTYGYRPRTYKKGDYIPLRYVTDGKGGGVSDDTIQFKFTQERTRKGGGTILVEPVTATIDRYINQSANHIAYAELGDQLALMNRPDIAGRTLTEIMKENYGEQMGQWMTNYVSDMNNFNPKENTDGVSTMLRKGRQAVQTGALVGSVSVPMKQISSYWAAAGKLRMSTLRKAYRIKFVGAKSKGTQNPLLYYRKVGGIDPTMSEIMNSEGLWAKMRNKSKILQAMEKSIPTMDFRTIDNLYTACVLEVKEDNPRLDVKSEKFQQMVNDKFEDVVISTQPIFTRNARAEYARTNNEFIKMFSMFRTQQTQNLNRIMQAIGEAKASKGTLGEFAAQSELGETIKGQAASALSLSLLTVLADTVLHKLKKYKDEDDEIDPEKVMERIGLNAIEAGSGTVWFADSALKFAIDTINKAQGKSSSEFYGVNMGIVSTIGNAAEAIGNLAKNPTLSNLQYTAGYISQAMGIPLSNAYRMINGAIAWTRDVVGHIEGDDKPGEWDDILRYLDSEVVIHPWGDNLNHKVHVMLNAESKGNDQKADRIFSELPGGDKVDSAIRSDVKSRVLGGSMSTDESEYILGRYTGMEEEDIQKKNDFLEFMRDNPTYNSDEYNISESFVQHWNNEGKPADIPLNQFYECMMKAKNTSSIDVDGDGKANGKGDITKQQQLIEYINGLALTKEQKDALWVAFGYKTTSEAFKKRPWR